MAILNTNGIELYYECRGSGPPLLLIAGIASDGQSWMPVVDELSRHYQLILPDNRGAGQTRHLDQMVTVSNIARDHAALITHLGFSKVHVLGHSMGGAIAMQIALQSPHMVDQLVLATATAKMSKRNRILFHDLLTLRQSGVDMVLWYKMLFQWLFRPAFFEDERRVEEAAKLALSYVHAQSNDNFSAQLDAISAVDFRDQLHRICAQTLILYAQDDILFPLTLVSNQLDDIPHSTMQVIENAGHSLHWDNPAAFCAAIRKFLL